MHANCETVTHNMILNDCPWPITMPVEFFHYTPEYHRFLLHQVTPQTNKENVRPQWLRHCWSWKEIMLPIKRKLRSRVRSVSTKEMWKSIHVKEFLLVLNSSQCSTTHSKWNTFQNNRVSHTAFRSKLAWCQSINSFICWLKRSS